MRTKAEAAPAGLTPREAARLLRVSADKVRLWIRRGELKAVNTGTHCRPRLIVLPGQLADFLNGRQAAPPPRPSRRKRTTQVDYYPD
jgi:excisionase family DNA binding protein